VPAVLGVDLGATNLRVALGDPSGALARGAAARLADGLIARASEPVPATGELLAERVAAIARDLAGGEPVGAAAVGVPGIPEGDGFAGLIAGAAGLSGAPLRRLLEDALGAPVAVDNDVNLAALAESTERGVDDLAFIAVGTGVGMGIVTDGRVLRGAHGAAGELGQLPVGDHIVAPPDDLGPLEAIAGGAGLARRHGSASAHKVFADPGAHALLDDQARALAVGVRAVQALLDPALIVLGGGIGCRPDVLDRLRAALGSPAPRVEPCRLGEDAGLLGALALAAQIA
jgi:predicted NBD/HSP70 family sugar kinase